MTDVVAEDLQGGAFLDPVSAPNANISFLPVNRSRSPPHVKKRRAAQSCEECRRRKVRCDFGPGADSSCRRCLRERKACVWDASRPNKRARSQSDGTYLVEGVTQDNLVGTSHGQEQLPSQTGHEQQQRQQQRIREHEHQHLYQHPRLPSFIESPSDRVRPSAASVSARSQSQVQLGDATNLDAKQRLMASQLHNTADALDLLTFAACGAKALQNEGSSLDGGSDADGTTPAGVRRGTGPDAGPRADGTTLWKRHRLIRRGIVTRAEAIEFLDFFFERLWPLSPVVPAFYRRPSSYSLLAAEEPVLLTAILTVSSRYHSLSGTHGDIRSERIHWHAWRPLQKYLQSSMWGATCTRSPGTIASMLLLIN